MHLLPLLSAKVLTITEVASPTLQYGEADGIKVSLLPNPSHLEAVSPVALGKARAKQYGLLKTLSSGKDNQDCMLGDKVLPQGISFVDRCAYMCR